MRRLLRVTLWAVAAVVCVLAAFALYLRNADLRVYEDEVEAYLSDKLGHEFNIDGRFELQVRGDITLTAESVSLRNPDWAGGSTLAEIGHISLVADFWSLVNGPIIVRELVVRDVNVSVQKSIDGSNWDTGRPKQDTPTEINTDLIAFRNVSVSSATFVYSDSERPRPINIVLKTLTVRPDEHDILDLDLQGGVNGFPLWADGRLGPWQNLIDGEDLTADLDLTLGQVQLAVDGTTENFLRLEGVEAELRLAGPSIERVTERLGMPPFAAGAFELDGKLRRLDAGNQVEVSGNLGQIQLLANGFIDSLRRPRETRYDFNVSGPDAKYISELFGVDEVPAVPFIVSGDIARNDRRFTFSASRAQLGDNNIGFDGWLDTGRNKVALDLTVDAKGPDFRVFAPFLGMANVPELGFEIGGRVRKDDDAWQFEDVLAVLGENRFSASGEIARGRDAALTFVASGPDNSILRALVGREGLPARPYDIAATARHERGAIRLEALQATFGDHRIDMGGLLSLDEDLAGTALEVTLRGPDLRNIALLAQVPYLPGGPYYADTKFRVERDRVDLEDLVIVVEELRAQATGSIGTGGRTGEFDLDVTARGPDVSKFGHWAWAQRLAGDAVSVTGKIRRAANDLELTSFTVGIGEVEASVTGKLNMQPLSNDSDLRFEASGPDLGHLAAAVGLDIFFPARPFAASGKFDGTPSGFAMQEFMATIGDNDIEGQLTANLQGKPTITASLASKYLDLTDRLRQTDSDAVAEGEEDSGLFFPDTPLDGSFLHTANLDFDLAIDRLVANQASMSDVRFDVNLMDGVLSAGPLSFRDADGSFNATIQVVPQDGIYELAANLAAANVRLGTLGSADAERIRRPPLNGSVRFQGAGKSVHEIMASANGRISLRQGAGQIPNRGTRIFGDLVLEVIRTLNPLRSKEKYRRLDCGIYEVSIVDGIAKLDDVAIQTDNLTTVASGKIDLETEKIDINIRAKPREGIGISLSGLTTALVKVGGTLKSPKIVLDTKGTAATTGVAVATGGISLIAKGLADRLSGTVDICAADKERARN